MAVRELQPSDHFLRFGDELTNFPLDRGRFGDAWDQSFNLDGGRKVNYHYATAGKVGGRWHKARCACRSRRPTRPERSR